MSLRALRERLGPPAARVAIGRDTATSQELLTVMTGDAAAPVLVAVGANRAAQPRLGEAVADAIAASADRPAIRALLRNPSTAIREATLDALIATAAERGGRITARLEAAAPAEASALEAARSGNRAALAGVLAAATGIVPQRIEAAIALRSPRVIAALCWRAGWRAAVAEAVQVAFGVEQARIVRGNAEGGWTLSPAEMQWQLQMLDDLPG
ncbi:MAG: hypothetical protein RLZZ187_2405 [Pseudomonadota bacterium]|jgi:hypothetical protein